MMDETTRDKALVGLTVFLDWLDQDPVERLHDVEMARPDLARRLRRVLGGIHNHNLGGDEPAQPETVCLCGSMRFYPLMLQVASAETQAGSIVLMPFVTMADDQQDSAGKKALDDLHRAKIRMSQRVIVVSDETGYYGESTRGEIEYATSLGLPVSFQTVEDEP